MILNSRSYILDWLETVWNFQDNISGHAKAHLNIFRNGLTIIVENPKIRVFLKFWDR